MFSKQKQLGMEVAMQYSAILVYINKILVSVYILFCNISTNMFRRDMGYTAAFPFFPGGGKNIYIAVVEDKISPQSQTWQASIYMISILC